MHFFGEYQTGHAMLIDRSALLIQLEALEAGTEFAIEQGRKQRLIESLERARKFQAAAAVRIPMKREYSKWWRRGSALHTLRSRAECGYRFRYVEGDSNGTAA